MSDCPIRLKAKATITDAERSRRLGAIYRIILEALRRATEEQGADGRKQ